MAARPADAPFGILEPVHRAALAAQPLGSLASWAQYALLPLIPLYLQAYLLVGQTPHPGLRLALGGIGIAVLVHGWLSFRFTNPELNAFNNAFTIVLIHLALKSIEFALLKDNVNDPYMRYGRRRCVAAVDIWFNSRLISMGSVGLDVAAGAPNATIRDIKVERHLRHGKKHHHAHGYRHVHPQNGSAVVNGSANGSAKLNGIANGSAHKHDAYVYSDLHRPKTRAGAIARHAGHALVHYVVLDTLLALLRRTGPNTLAVTATQTQPGLFHKFVSQTGVRVLPGVLDWDVHPFLVEFWTQCCVPIVIWQALSGGFHVVAALTLSTGLWEVRSWDVDLFDAPWKADSLIDLWGKRWHQLFRHQFIILSSATLSALRLPNTPFTLFPLTFFYSGLLHALGELSMNPVPAPVPLASFFFLTGVGCAAEVVVKRITGKRVRGPLGRVWTWTTMFFAGRIATNAWFDAGIAGNRLLPENGPGELIAPWLLSWAFKPYSRV